MKRSIAVSFFCLLFISTSLFAQSDVYTGTWNMEYLSSPGNFPVNIELKIATPEKNVLYPAQLKIQSENFTGEYELLLVKKNGRELGVSRNKYALSEKPFCLGNAVTLLNGVLGYGKDLKGNPSLTISRMLLKDAGIAKADTANLDKADKAKFIQLRNILKDADIQLKKINSVPLKKDNEYLVLSTSVSPAYFGLKDTARLQNRNGTVTLTGNKKSTNDIVSISLNGRTVIDQQELDKKKHTEDISIDTGLNILTVFADNFGGYLPSKGRVDLEFDKRKLTLDFDNKADSAAGFIVAKLYCDKDTANEKSFQTNIAGFDEKTLKKNDRMIGSIVSTSQELTLAIWDDAAEDGDSISINIDGRWIVRGFPVKKNPQFLTVNLKPGANTITFIADNLGSIPPNTSVLEIIDGKKRKSFTIATNLGENNLVKILYDTKAGL